MAREGRERGRLKIQWIMDNKKRKAVLRKRLPILLKKIRELSILCDIPACLMVYCPGEAQPVVWPSPQAASKVLRRYRETLDLPRFKNKLDGMDFLEQVNEKSRVKLSKVQRKSRDEEIKLILHDFLAGRRKSFNDLPADFFASIASRVDTKLDAVKARLQELRSHGASPPPPAPEDVPMLLQPWEPPSFVETPLPPWNSSPSSMTWDSEPRHDSYLFETMDAFDAIGQGSALPTIEEMYESFVQAGIFSQLP